MAASVGIALPNESSNFYNINVIKSRTWGRKWYHDAQQAQENSYSLTAGWQSCDAPLGTHVGRFATLDLEFELEQLEIETRLDAIENIDKIEKFTKIVQIVIQTQGKN